MQGYLATINTLEEFLYIKSTFVSSNLWVYVSGSDSPFEGRWRITAGPDAGQAPYLLWGSGEPNGGGGENCIVLGPNNLADISCSSGYRYLIEYECRLPNTADCADECKKAFCAFGIDLEARGYSQCLREATIITPSTEPLPTSKLRLLPLVKAHIRECKDTWRQSLHNLRMRSCIPFSSSSAASILHG